jgi:hypothetical protein
MLYRCYFYRAWSDIRGADPLGDVPRRWTGIGGVNEAARDGPDHSARAENEPGESSLVPGSAGLYIERPRRRNRWRIT